MKSHAKQRTQHDDVFKISMVKLSCASSKSVWAITADLGTADNLLYNWRKKYTASGEVFPTE